MKLSKRQKRALYILGGIFIFLVAVVITLNLIIGHIIGNKVRQALDKQPEKNYHIDVGTVRANILTGNVNLKDLTITPDSLFLQHLKNGESKHATAFQLYIPTLRFAGINIYKALTEKYITFRAILFIKADFTLILGKKPVKKLPQKENIKLNIDSIYIAGISGVNIGSIEFRKSKVKILNLVQDKVLLENNKMDFKLNDFYLNKLDGDQNLFSLHLENIKFDLRNEVFQIPDGNYSLYFGRIYFDLSESMLEFEHMTFKTTYKDKYKLAKKLRFTSEIYDVVVGKINIYSMDIRRLINDGAIIIDSVNVNQLNLSILMDKRLPFNENKRPKLPNEALKNMKLPLYIGKINISNSYINYQEKIKEAKALMTATLSDLNARISFATSIKDSIKTHKSLTINLEAKLMKRTPLKIDFRFPLYSTVDTFYYNGSLAAAKLNNFNKASLPAMGLKFNEGKLKSITFSGSANAHVSKGKMTMLYDNLEAEIVKKNAVDKNKFVSWAANTVIYKSNPGKNNKLRVAIMEFERVPYKGFGNFIWKTLQSGIVRTVTPSSKSSKTNLNSKNKNQNNTKRKQKKRKKRKKNN